MYIGKVAIWQNSPWYYICVVTKNKRNRRMYLTKDGNFENAYSPPTNSRFKSRREALSALSKCHKWYKISEKQFQLGNVSGLAIRNKIDLIKCSPK